MSGSLSPKPMVDASDDRGHLLTEQSNPRSRQLDTLPVAELVDLFISEDVKPQQAVEAAAESIAQAVEGSIRLAAGGRLFYVGAGTSRARRSGCCGMSPDLLQSS